MPTCFSRDHLFSYNGYTLPYRKSMWACGVVVSMFDFHRSDRGSNPGRGGEFS